MDQSNADLRHECEVRATMLRTMGSDLEVLLADYDNTVASMVLAGLHIASSTLAAISEEL